MLTHALRCMSMTNPERATLSAESAPSPPSAKSGNTGAQVLRLMPFASPEPHLLRDGNADDQGPGGSGDVSAGDNADDGSGLPAGGGGGGSRGYGALAAPVVATVPPSPGIAGKFPELRSMVRARSASRMRHARATERPSMVVSVVACAFSS